MADTTRVTVPVEPTEEMIEAGAGKKGVSAYRAMLSAAPAPEGVADAWRIRTKENLHGDDAPAGRWIVSNILSLSSDTAHWYEIQPLRVSKPSQADLDAMEAYGVKVAALAACEEAPAEAGEDDGAWIIYFEDRDRELESFSGFGAREAAQRRYEQVTVSWNAHLFERVKSALPARAQPQAREARDCGNGHQPGCDCDVPEEDVARSKPPAREDAQPVYALEVVRDPTVEGAKRFVGVAHPDPDAVRVAAIAFRDAVSADIPATGERYAAWVEKARAARADLDAALQAEQKGGA